MESIEIFVKGNWVLKRIVCGILCLIMIVGCFAFTKTKVDAYPTNWGNYSVDYMTDLNTK